MNDSFRQLFVVAGEGLAGVHTAFYVTETTAYPTPKGQVARVKSDILSTNTLCHRGEHIFELSVQPEVYIFRVLLAKVGVLDRDVMSA